MDRLQIGIQDEIAFREQACGLRNFCAVVIDNKSHGRSGNQ